MTAGTIFDRTRTPLTVWFTACWLFATQKDGISAQSLQRSLEIGSYPTAWAVLADGSAESLNPFVTGAVEPGIARSCRIGRRVMQFAMLGHF